MPTFGPTRAAARIEWSKAFCRDVAAAAGVRMARGRDFAALEPALAFARELAEAPRIARRRHQGRRPDGRQGRHRLRRLSPRPRRRCGRSSRRAARGEPGRSPVVVVEERLIGAEASLIALCDDHGALALPPARDHKRLLDDDAGPNTGGMGAYSPVPDLPESLCATLVDVIHLPILAELARRGAPFRGALYAGLMLTPEGPGPDRVQRPLRRPGDPGPPAAPGGAARAAALRRRAGRPGRGGRRARG